MRGERASILEKEGGRMRPPCTLQVRILGKILRVFLTADYLDGAAKPQALLVTEHPILLPFLLFLAAPHPGRLRRRKRGGRVGPSPLLSVDNENEGRLRRWASEVAAWHLSDSFLSNVNSLLWFSIEGQSLVGLIDSKTFSKLLSTFSALNGGEEERAWVVGQRQVGGNEERKREKKT